MNSLISIKGTYILIENLLKLSKAAHVNEIYRDAIALTESFVTISYKCQ